MKIARLLSILGMLAFGANVAAADPPGKHVAFTGTYFTSPTPPAAEILQLHGDGTAILTTSDQVTVGAGGLTFSDSIGSWKAIGPRTLSARFLNLNFAGTIPSATFAGTAVVDYVYQFSASFGTITVTCLGRIFAPGVDPLDPSSTPFITFDCSNLNGHPYRRVQVP
jgi:hypothetical protein